MPFSRVTVSDMFVNCMGSVGMQALQGMELETKKTVFSKIR